MGIYGTRSHEGENDMSKQAPVVVDEPTRQAPGLRSVPKGTMILTAQQILDANAGLTSIMDNRRAMPVVAKHCMARMRRVLMVEAADIIPQRDEVIKEIGEEVFQKQNKFFSDKGEDPPVPVPMVPPQWKVSDAKMPEYLKAVQPLLDKEHYVAITSMRLSDMGEDCTIETFEFELLGELITE